MKYKINQKVIIIIPCYNSDTKNYIDKEFIGVIKAFKKLNIRQEIILYKVYIKELKININIQNYKIKGIIGNNIKKL